MSNQENNDAPVPDRVEDDYFFDHDNQLTWGQPPSVENDSSAPVPRVEWDPLFSWVDDQATNQQQTQASNESYYQTPDHYNQGPFASNPGYGYSGSQPLNYPSVGQVYPGPFVQQGPHIPYGQHTYPDPATHQSSYTPYAQHAYPALQPAQTWPQAATYNTAPLPVAPVQQATSSGIGAIQRASLSRRRRHQEEEGQEDEDDDQQNKKFYRKSKSEKGIETKKRKKQDVADRRDLSQLRDEVATRLFEMAQQHLPPNVVRAFSEHFDMLMELNQEIDRNTESYIEWNGTRPNHRQSARAVPKRRQGQ
ncbi:hypothetical protein QM012_009377 [Aureobasidium pullulans]|uniref:BZIP domain-containing protein n=1 Tax=Aureobasidium pullulans TaxID=5580 RepID=A0ABR0TI73_AURPU